MKGKDFYSSYEKRDLPQPPLLRRALGVGVIVMGLAIGTGELILWPHLITKFGLGLLWLALVGITLQYFINQEVARHTLATGESIFASTGRIWSWLPFFWLLSTIILYIWPAWAGTLGTVLAELFGFGNYLIWAWISLFSVLIITFIGKRAYKVLETALKIIVPVFFVLLLFFSFLNLKIYHFKEIFLGLINFGWIPVNIDMEVLLGAIVFAGAGGLLNLCISLWYRDKGLGMAKYAGHITNPVTGKTEAVDYKGYAFENTAENLKKWRKWMKYVFIDQGIIFWFLGLITLILLSANAYVVLSPRGLVPEGLQLATLQAMIFEETWGVFGSKLFLFMAFLMLFSTMWTILDVAARIISDILYTRFKTKPPQKYFRKIKNISIHHLYYGLIIGFVIISAILLPFEEPFVFIITTSVLGGFVMTIYVPILIYFNNFKLPKPLRPGLITNFFMFSAFLLYLYFSIMILSTYF
jgi:hypothetical protein